MPRSWVRAWVLVSSVLGLACAAEPPRKPMLGEWVDSPQLSVPPEQAVRDLRVELGPEVLAHPRHEDAEAYGVTTRLFNQIGGELVARGRASAAGETVVHVTVTGFRLRHDQLSYWVGSYAGADLLAVHVEASRGGEVVDRFDTSASSVLAGIASGSGNQRLDRVVKEVSRRVADGLASSEAEAAPADAEGPAGRARHAVQDERESLPTGPDDRGPWSGGLDPADP